MAVAQHIVVVTGSRAEYGLLSWLMRDIAADPRMRLSVIATGMHCSQRFGSTIDDIHRDGFQPLAVPCLEDGDSNQDVARSLGRAVIGMADALAPLRPDLVLVLGDRFEILGAVQAAMILKIPVAHLHGGELTEGAMDESIRHAISKMSALHFVAAKPYARRLIRMGEQPDRVYVVGALGVQAAACSPDVDDADLNLGLPLCDPTLLVTYHPVTLRKDDDGKAVSALLSALDRHPQARVVFTGVNADPGNQRIKTLIGEWTQANGDRASMHESLGQRRYMAVMKRAACVVGNSSSGLIEAPALGVPTVNIGARQDGRLKADSVIDCGEDADAIALALAQALDPGFRAKAFVHSPPYGGGDVSGAILRVLKSTDLSTLLRKPFHDEDGQKCSPN